MLYLVLGFILFIIAWKIIKGIFKIVLFGIVVVLLYYAALQFGVLQGPGVVSMLTSTIQA